MVITNMLKKSYFNNDLLAETKEESNKLLNVIKDSPILQLEYQIYNNIKNKYIENESLATRYIDNNIKLFEVYTIQELNEEHKKLEKIFTINENVSVDGDETQLYSSINNLIEESLQHNIEVDVDAIHESFKSVLSHVMKPKNLTLETKDIDIINEDIIEIAIEKFNSKYKQLNESDKTLFQSLINSNTTEKKDIFESYKKESINILNGVNKNNIKANISKAIQKIDKMEYNKDSVMDDIIDLHELKTGLI